MHPLNNSKRLEYIRQIRFGFAFFLSAVPSKTDDYSIRQSSVLPAVTASATASAGSSVSQNGISQRTVQEIQKGNLFIY